MALHLLATCGRGPAQTRWEVMRISARIALLWTKTGKVPSSLAIRAHWCLRQWIEALRDNGWFRCRSPLEPGIGSNFQDCRRRGKLVHAASDRQRHGDRGLRAAVDRSNLTLFPSGGLVHEISYFT